MMIFPGSPTMTNVPTDDALTPQAEIFTVYQAGSTIELHTGCVDYPNYRVICSCLSYESAYEIAMSSAQSKQLPMIDYAALNHGLS